jgi:hypothetical protein
VKLVVDLTGESPGSVNYPVGAVVISGDGAGDQTVGSPDVNACEVCRAFNLMALYRVWDTAVKTMAVVLNRSFLPTSPLFFDAGNPTKV